MLRERLLILLKQLNLSQRQFAEGICLDPGHFSRIIQDKAIPSKRILLLIENIYHVNRMWLETGEGPIFNHNDDPHCQKGEILRIIDTLNESQIHSTLVFLKYLVE